MFWKCMNGYSREQKGAALRACSRGGRQTGHRFAGEFLGLESAGETEKQWAHSECTHGTDVPATCSLWNIGSLMFMTGPKIFLKAFLFNTKQYTKILNRMRRAKASHVDIRAPSSQPSPHQLSPEESWPDCMLRPHCLSMWKEVWQSCRGNPRKPPTLLSSVRSDNQGSPGLWRTERPGWTETLTCQDRDNSEHKICPKDWFNKSRELPKSITSKRWH